jgi:hypothetical protein
MTFKGRAKCQEVVIGSNRFGAKIKASAKVLRHSLLDVLGRNKMPQSPRA